jgi:O-methyltransferase domain/IclR helix-turn-helix domain
MQNATPTPQERLQAIRLAVWQSQAISAAVKLELAEALADGPLNLPALAARTGTDAPTLYRLLRALETAGLFTEIEPGVFGNTDASNSLRAGVPGSQRALVMRHFTDADGQWQVWGALDEAVRTGEAPFDKVHGCDFWEYGRRHPEAATRFNETMRATSAAVTPVIAAAYDWDRFPVIADIAGGIGTQLVAILDRFPAVRGILFDQPHVGAEAIAHPRVSVAGGDFFIAVPEGADAYLLRWILHDWPDAKAMEILRVVRRAMRPEARLVLVEAVVPPGAAYSFGKWADLLMLVNLAGRERTEAEFATLLDGAGFRLEQTLATECPLSILFAAPVP